MLLCCVAAEACSYCAAVAAEACVTKLRSRRRRAGHVRCCKAAVLVAAARDATRPCAVIVTQQYRRDANGNLSM